ncbi:hypothetical protein [Burkholderia vietnamiensis]|uniref:hypothetical protein n=1 Tax=Burkholderia vietnamiensis TaxID=60552 RepID=UPI000A3D8DB8|nr:hypothetical protein [Burkholderia vietnamiensis]
MADTFTPFLNLTKPEVGGDPDTWGTLLNSDLDKIDANAALNMPKSGGTFTGQVTISGASQGPLILASTGQYCGVVISGTGNGTAYSPRIQTNADPNVKSIGIVNGANTAYNLLVYDDGRVVVQNNNLTVGSAVYQTDGNISGPVWGGPISSWLANNKAQKTGDTIGGRFNFAKQGWQADLQLSNLIGTGNANVFLRARQGGGLEIINSNYNAVPWQSDDSGQTWQQSNLNVGNARFQTDGNLYMPWYGGYLSDALGAKASAGAQCVYASGQVEFDYVGSVNSNIHGQIDMNNPWVSNGLRVNASTSSITAIWQRAIWLRNQ